MDPHVPRGQTTDGLHEHSNAPSCFSDVLTPCSAISVSSVPSSVSVGRLAGLSPGSPSQPAQVVVQGDSSSSSVNEQDENLVRSLAQAEHVLQSSSSSRSDNSVSQDRDSCLQDAEAEERAKLRQAKSLRRRGLAPSANGSGGGNPSTTTSSSSPATLAEAADTKIEFDHYLKRLSLASNMNMEAKDQVKAAQEMMLATAEKHVQHMHEITVKQGELLKNTSSSDDTMQQGKATAVLKAEQQDAMATMESRLENALTAKNAVQKERNELADMLAGLRARHDAALSTTLDMRREESRYEKETSERAANTRVLEKKVAGHGTEAEGGDVSAKSRASEELRRIRMDVLVLAGETHQKVSAKANAKACPSISRRGTGSSCRTPASNLFAGRRQTSLGGPELVAGLESIEEEDNDGSLKNGGGSGSVIDSDPEAMSVVGRAKLDEANSVIAQLRHEVLQARYVIMQLKDDLIQGKTSNCELKDQMSSENASMTNKVERLTAQLEGAREDRDAFSHEVFALKTTVAGKSKQHELDLLNMKERMQANEAFVEMAKESQTDLKHYVVKNEDLFIKQLHGLNSQLALALEEKRVAVSRMMDVLRELELVQSRHDELQTELEAYRSAQHASSRGSTAMEQINEQHRCLVEERNTLKHTLEWKEVQWKSMLDAQRMEHEMELADVKQMSNSKLEALTKRMKAIFKSTCEGSALVDQGQWKAMLDAGRKEIEDELTDVKKTCTDKSEAQTIKDTTKYASSWSSAVEAVPRDKSPDSSTPSFFSFLRCPSRRFQPTSVGSTGKPKLGMPMCCQEVCWQVLMTCEGVRALMCEVPSCKILEASRKARGILGVNVVGRMLTSLLANPLRGPWLQRAIRTHQDLAEMDIASEFTQGFAVHPLGRLEFAGPGGHRMDFSVIVSHFPAEPVFSRQARVIVVLHDERNSESSSFGGRKPSSSRSADAWQDDPLNSEEDVTPSDSISSFQKQATPGVSKTGYRYR
eukprot:TRINITY_DN24033_c0_g1_i1.p1 TRINITY_DN24033_c0_g1~~TRINITY_DN24033_c0_g1_i1.p1  ORF type:complete len:985 (-),score=202.96 TRINITY_DN24033_c0_g1_i1:115-3069(-)